MPFRVNSIRVTILKRAYLTGMSLFYLVDSQEFGVYTAKKPPASRRWLLIQLTILY